MTQTQPTTSPGEIPPTPVPIDGDGDGAKGVGAVGVFTKRRKNKFPVLFNRQGKPVVERSKIKKDVELALGMAALNLLDRTSVHETFEGMGLAEDILKGIQEYGLEKPAFIQQRAIVPCVKGQDAIVQAQSGMGKTAALVIAVLQRIDRSEPMCQAIIVVPTRELAEQIFGVVKDLGQFMNPKVTSTRCIGGITRGKALKAELIEGRQIVVGTVGRIRHMLVGDGDGPYLDTNKVKTFALDEADQLLDSRSNFGLDLTQIFGKIPNPNDCQMILMSATMPSYILQLAYRFMENPVTFLVRDFQLTLDGIQQYYVNIGSEDAKMETLLDLYPLIEQERGMIFCNTRKRVSDVMNFMKSRGFEVAHMTGQMMQKDRDEITKKFRRGEEGYRVIITSDILGRGIDVKQINFVVNYDLPELKETYIHRVGRAGRYGRKGVALSFVTERQMTGLAAIREFYQTSIPPMPPANDFSKILGSTVCSQFDGKLA